MSMLTRSACILFFLIQHSAKTEIDTGGLLTKIIWF